MQNYINPKLLTYINKYVENPLQGLLIIGPRGSGKGYIISTIIDKMQLRFQKIEVYEVKPEENKTSIGINQIKMLKTSLRASHPYHTIIVVEDADLMTIDAQNSLLKILEEPPINIHYILSTSNQTLMLKTIQSRLIIWRYLSPTIQQQKQFLNSNIPNDLSKDKILTLASGRMGLMYSLTIEHNNHILKISIELAKEILSESISKRLLRVDALSKDKEQILNLLDAMSLLCYATVKSSIRKGATYKQWLYRLKECEYSAKMLDSHVQNKLVLTRLLLVL